MGEKYYPVKNKYIVFDENNDEFGCLCTFPHNYNEKLNLADLQTLAIFGAVVRLVLAGYYDNHDEYVFIPNDVPQWIIDGIKNIGKDE